MTTIPLYLREVLSLENEIEILSEFRDDLEACVDAEPIPYIRMGFQADIERINKIISDVEQELYSRECLRSQLKVVPYHWRYYFDGDNQDILLYGKTNTMEINVTEEQLQSWQEGDLIQIAMPHLTADEREFIMTGITSEEWDEVFQTRGS